MPGDEVINSDLDDSEGELDDDGEGDDEADVDIVFCVYDKVSLMSCILASKLTVAGATSQKQVEDRFQGRHDPYQWPRLSLPQVQRVCTFLCFKNSD
jgi:hypothetical protein